MGSISNNVAADAGRVAGKESLRVFFVNCRQDGVDETGVLRILMADAKNLPGVEVKNPAAADLILITGILEDNTFESLRSNNCWRQHPEKCFGYSETDNVPLFLHGVYSSASRFKGLFNRMQSCGYPGHSAWRPNPCPLSLPLHRHPKQYLFSFIGRISHPVRKKLFQISWQEKDVFVADTTTGYDRFQNPGQNHQTMQGRYWEVTAQSKFVLCPRGAGASSIRLFEAMQAGVAPVIISDAWKPSVGPDWNEFAIFIPERKIHNVHDILTFHESEWSERGQRAAEAYQKWFSDEAAWGQLLKAIETIRSSQKIPERWFVRGSGVIFCIERLHEWRYKLPIMVKSVLRRTRKRPANA